MSVLLRGCGDNCLNVQDLKYTRSGEGRDTQIYEASDQASLRGRQVVFWTDKKISLSKLELVSKCIAVYSSFVITYAIKNRGKCLGAMASMIGVLSYVVKLLAARAEAKAQEQKEAWSIPMEHRALAVEFRKHLDGLDKKGMTTDQYIWHLLMYKNAPSPLEEKVSRISYLLNFFQTSFRKEIT